ncbi:hypothetical protein PMI15_01423 [Polaromonas sp. CF318]|jgi:hypothetical protein|uniref:hypothetical protein n=1 Tax=Polaromonas sp. CF318 TaxID=1144318 RepID=UPI0002710105|nr:hypothetical protein [Polaromonas sp. CF318]EJL86576.1 hypothetical protein PMI15_01423 [Polaromonas sp. CF318]
MAYAAYCESFGLTPSLHVPRPVAVRWVVMDVTVRSRDALRVRRALVNCAGAGILRCIPQLDEHRARLEIRLTAHSTAEVMDCVMACVPDGVIGPLVSWRRHLQRRGLSHGL